MFAKEEVSATIQHSEEIDQELLFERINLLSPASIWLERILEVIIAFIGLVLAFPFLVLFAITIKIDSKGPVFYTQERVGLRGETFRLIKLRTMTVNAECNGPQWAKKNDPRVTRIGKFLRSTRVDEIPQLVNVLKGEMSIVGPRPERPFFTEKFGEQIPGFINRLAVKPGVTGLAQINGGYDLSPIEKLKYDLDYIRNKSLRIDAIIVLKTIKVVFTGDGAR